MMTFINIAWNNLLRNRRRTLSTLAAIGIGVAMIVFTNGFTDGTSADMSGLIVDQIDSHLRIEHKDHKKYFITDQEKILIDNYSQLAAQIEKMPHVKAVSPRIMIGGLVGVGDKSATFFGSAVDFKTVDQVLPAYGKNLKAGQLLSIDDPEGVLVGQALAKSLKVTVGDELVLLSKTIHGDQSNTLVHVRGIITFPNDYEAEQSLILAGLGKGISDNLLDLGNGTTQLLVRLDDTDNVLAVERDLGKFFEKNNMPWRVVPWYENPVFNRVVGILNGIGAGITFILTLMVGIITSNALLMAFFERIREIGTMRAIGMNKIQVSLLLYIESAMVGVAGALAGLLIGVAAVGVARHIGIPFGLLGQSIFPTLKGDSLMVAAVAPIVCIVIAAAIPIRAASRMSVIESLNHQ